VTKLGHYDAYFPAQDSGAIRLTANNVTDIHVSLLTILLYHTAALFLQSDSVYFSVRAARALGDSGKIFQFVGLFGLKKLREKKYMY
tara:strand:- start:1228 stop:1488 length:261 start_codon:yes stop_codon:yes gene_type:complete